MTNINQEVCRYIDSRVEVKKTLLDGLVNVSALARKIAKEQGLEDNIDAIISAIRRYEGGAEKSEYPRFYDLLSRATISTKTKLAYILLERNDQTQGKVCTVYSKVNLKRDNTLMIFNATNYVKIISDMGLLEQVKGLFNAKDIIKVEKNLGEVRIDYTDDITKIPGVFGTMANELAMNGISMVDSLICHWEHMIIVKEKDLEKAFTVVFNLSKAK